MSRHIEIIIPLVVVYLPINAGLLISDWARIRKLPKLRMLLQIALMLSAGLILAFYYMCNTIATEGED